MEPPRHADLVELDHAYRSTPVGMCLLDRDFRYVKINRQLADRNDKPVSEHVGRTVQDILPPDLLLLVEPALRKVRDKAKPVLNRIARPRLPSGEEDLLVSYYPVLSPDGKVQHISVMVQEITQLDLGDATTREELQQVVDERTRELDRAHARLSQEIAAREEATLQRQKAAQKLAASEKRYRDLYDNAPDMFFSIAAASGKILRCNDTLAEKTGFAKGEIIGRSVFELYHPDCLESARQAFRTFQDTGRVRDAELVAIRKDGSKMEVSLNDSAIRDDGGKVLHSRSVWRDITQRKEMERALRQSELAQRKSQRELRALTGKLLSAQEQERRRLARDLHDELSQKLAVLAMEVEQIEKEYESQPEAMCGKLRAMKDRMVELSTVVHRMSHHLHPSILDDLGLADAMETECKRLTEGTGLAVSLVMENIPKELPKDISLCLYRITQESLLNVVKHAQVSTATVVLRATADAITLTIRDTGVGFDPSRKGEKVGLGLASMKERVRLVQGTLAVRSRLGRGTTIEVQAPLMAKTEVAAPAASDL